MLTRSQELGSMYDYLAKVILIGPSGCGKYAESLHLFDCSFPVLYADEELGLVSCTVLSRMSVS